MKKMSVMDNPVFGRIYDEKMDNDPNIQSQEDLNYLSFIEDNRKFLKENIDKRINKFKLMNVIDGCLNKISSNKDETNHTFFTEILELIKEKYNLNTIDNLFIFKDFKNLTYNIYTAINLIIFIKLDLIEMIWDKEIDTDTSLDDFVKKCENKVQTNILNVFKLLQKTDYEMFLKKVVKEAYETSVE